jgi:hypothetical protein
MFIVDSRRLKRALSARARHARNPSLPPIVYLTSSFRSSQARQNTVPLVALRIRTRPRWVRRCWPGLVPPPLNARRESQFSSAQLLRKALISAVPPGAIRSSL